MSGLALVGLVPLIMIGIFATIQGVKNTIQLLNEQPTHYPQSSKFVR